MYVTSLSATIIAAMLLASGCLIEPDATPTSTPFPTSTPQPTPTPSPPPTPTQLMDERTVAVLYVVDNLWRISTLDVSKLCEGKSVMSRIRAWHLDWFRVQDKVESSGAGFAGLSPGWHNEIRRLAKELEYLIGQVMRSCY